MKVTWASVASLPFGRGAQKQGPHHPRMIPRPRGRGKARIEPQYGHAGRLTSLRGTGGGRRLGGSARRAAARRGALIAASVLIHIAILLPIALSTARTPPPPPDLDLFVLPLDLTPALSKRRVRRSASPSPFADPSAPAAGPIEPPSALASRTPAPLAPDAAPAAGAAIDDGWRVRAGLRPPASLPCPAAPGDRLGQRLCLVGAAPNRDREPETYAEVAPSRRDRSDEAREEGFDQQARANEAWRDYTRGEGAYPGLRSLFKNR